MAEVPKLDYDGMVDFYNAVLAGARRVDEELKRECRCCGKKDVAAEPELVKEVVKVPESKPKKLEHVSGIVKLFE